MDWCPQLHGGDQPRPAGANLFVLPPLLPWFGYHDADDENGLNDITTGICLSKFSETIFHAVWLCTVLLHLISTLDAA